MKRTVIGGILMLGGLLMVCAIIIAGAIYSTQMTAWSGKSKLWFAIFGREQYGNETVQSMFLGFPFIVGIVFVFVGLIILGQELYKIHQMKQD
ncbi:hypothetical protein EQV77_06255 [Halobacillus fulvus]|nr:hypothetical protein EQV77_06255 [Halobacillus fulvus]